MLTAAEISAGTARLDANNKLKASDQETLLSVFRLYLKSYTASFPDLGDRLSALTDTDDVKTAAKLAAILTQIEDSGFAVGELTGTKTGLKFSQKDQMGLQIRFALTLLGYDLPEDFSGSIGASSSPGSLNLDCNYTESVPINFW